MLGAGEGTSRLHYLNFYIDVKIGEHFYVQCRGGWCKYCSRGTRERFRDYCQVQCPRLLTALALVWTQFSRSIFVSDLTPLHTCEHPTVVSQRTGVFSPFIAFFVI